MSWQAYVDTSLVASGHINKAAIISAAGDSTWAKSPDFEVKPEEQKVLVNILNEAPGAVESAQADGIYINGTRFVVTTRGERSVYGRQGRTGVVVVKTKQSILVGFYAEGGVAGNAAQTVESLADYMIGLGY